LPMRALTALLLATAAVSANPQSAMPQPITAKRLQAHLEFIAHDLLEGRDTPSRGLDIAAIYIAAQLKIWGVEPGGDDGTYFQKVETKISAVDPKTTTLTINGKAMQIDRDFDAYLPESEISGEVVYVGFGFRAPSRGVDPYKGLDVKGKVLLIVNGVPKELPTEELYGGKIADVEYPIQAAARLGAKAILIAKPDDQGVAINIGANIPNIVLKRNAVEELMEGERVGADTLFSRTGTNDAGESFALAAGKTVAVKITRAERTLTYKNVVGIVRGSDPRLREEYVAIGAHYDHVGKQGESTATQDNIWNGADDDGSGTVATLEIAHAFATGPKPKRSTIFVWHAGEEKGLWGSAYFADHPTVPIDKIVTQLNIDMIGRSRKPGDTNIANKDLSDENSIYVIGSRMLSDDLGDAVVSVNKGLYNMRLDFKYDDPNDPEQFYYRSDHYNYAQKGIPIAFFFNGVHEDYHGPDDEVEKIDFVRMEKVTRTIYAIGFNIAMRAERPKVNKKAG
jgi:hypothetical protein